MDDPIQDVSRVIHKLTQNPPNEQAAAIDAYFTPNASFTHPFCRTGSFEGSRHLIHSIYRWYKILSPKIDLTVHSVAFDETTLLCYVKITQLFSLWFIPFYHERVSLVTELQLVRPPSSHKYYIQAQNDLYQTDQFFKFFAPWGLGWGFVTLWHYWATLMCVIGAVVLAPLTWAEEAWAGKKEGVVRGRVMNGVDGVGRVEDRVEPDKREGRFGGMQVVRPG
ncbi:hypothetical protein MBLNU230_g0010t1 [Neophaeotheca triangularis]